MTCPVCSSSKADQINEAMATKPAPGWKRLSKATGFSIPHLMAHKSHIIAANAKDALKRAGNKIRRGGGDSSISLDTISRRLNKLSIAAEASGNSGDAIKALAALQQTLQQMRDTGDHTRKVEVHVKYDQGAITNPKPAVIASLTALLDTKPDSRVAMHASALLGLLEPPATAPAPKIKVLSGPASLQ